MAYQSRYMREKYGEKDDSFKKYVSRVQQAIDKAPEAQPQWLQNKKTQTSILSTAQYGQQQQSTAQDAWKGFGVNDPSKGDWSEWGKNAPANLVDLIKMQYDNPSNQTGFAAGSVAGASAPSNDELVAFRTELSNSPDIAMRYHWANASDEDVAAELQRRKQAELQNQEYQRLMEENAKNMTLDDYIDPSYRLNDFDKTRAQEIIDAFYEKYPKDGKWYNGDYSPNTRKAMYNDPDMQKIVILENKLNPVASLVYGAKNALPIDPFGKTYENAVEKLYDAVGADQSAYDTLHNTMEGTRSASSNAQTQNPVAYLGGYMGTNLGLYKGGKDIMLGLPGIGKGLKAAGGAISNAASKVPVVGSTLGRVLTADRVAGFLGDSALDLTLDTIPNEVVTGLEEGESAAQIAKDAAGNMAQNALFNVAGEVVPATIKGTSNLITRGQMNRIADALDDGAKLTAEQISEYNRLAAKVGEIGSEDWLNVNMAKYADEMPMKNAAQPIATGTEASVPSMADMFPLSNKTPVQSETDALVNAFYNNTLTNAQIETLKPGGKNRAAFEAATGLPLPETASKTRALLKLGAEESIDGTLKTEYNGVSGGVQNGTANPASASVASGEGIPLERQGFGSDSNVASGRQYTGGNRGTVSFLTNDAITSDALSRVGSAYVDMHDTTAQPQVFTAALDDAIKANKHGLMVSPKTPQELADSGAVTFMTNDGLAGAAVTADGDIEAVFKNPTSQIKRASAPLMLNAIENGGRKLDCYGIGLVNNYNTFGFEPVARVAWNPEYAPDGWTYGPKDVYVMKLSDGVDAAAVKARLGLKESEGGFHAWTQPELDALPEMDYDEALAYRDSLLEQGAKPDIERPERVQADIYKAGQTWPNALFPDVQMKNTDISGQPLPWENTVGAKQSEFSGKQGVSRVAANTYENTPMFTEAEKNAAQLNGKNSEYKYDVVSEKQSLKEAAQRVAVDKEGELAELPTKERFDGTDTDTAMLILQDEMQAAQKTGDYSRARRWAKMIQEKGTEAGQRIQAFAKYTRTPEGTVVKGERYLDAQREMWRGKNPKQAENIENFVSDLERAAREKQGHANVDAFENDLSRLMDEDVFGRATDAAARAEKLISETAKKHDIKMKPDAVAQLAQQIVEGRLNASDAIDMLVEIESGIGRLGDSDFKQIYDLMSQAMQYGENSRQRVELEKQAYKIIADKVKTTFMDKWDAWRYIAMLTNPTTHIKNIFGNTGFFVEVGVKDRIAGAIESLFLKNGAERSHANLTLADWQLVKDSVSDADTVYRLLTGEGKYNPSRGIKDQQTVFKTKWLEALRTKSGNSLEAEDWFFLKRNYGRSLAGYLKANGMDASILKSTAEADIAFLDKARAYAINEAQKATFRDFSKLANQLNHMSQSLRNSDSVWGKLGYIGIEGTVPFKKTPVNVLKRGVEYSPVSLATGIYDTLVKVPKGKITASQAIDKISAGLTGTGIMLLGGFLMSKGLLTLGGSGDKKEDDFEELQGNQNYALNINGKSYTIDWLAPAALPLFIGAEVYNLIWGEDSTDDNAFNAFVTSLSRIGEPMLEMTMLQGLNDMIEGIKYDDGSPLVSLFTTAATNYITQGVPTFSGKIARSTDPLRRSFATDNTGAAGSLEYLFNKTKNKIPGLSQTLQPYVDQWGRTQENTGGNFAGRLAYNMLSPGFYSENKTTQVDDWLSQLYDRTGEKSVLPANAGRTVKVNGEDRRLKGEEYTTYAKERGQTAYDILEVLVPGYKDLTDEQAVHATEKAYDVATEFAKQEALGIEPDKEEQNTIERAEKWGNGDWMAGIADILKADALTYNVKGDKIPGTDTTIRGSVKRNKIAVLVDAGYSQYQAMQLYDLLNG